MFVIYILFLLKQVLEKCIKRLIVIETLSLVYLYVFLLPDKITNYPSNDKDAGIYNDYSYICYCIDHNVVVSGKLLYKKVRTFHIGDSFIYFK